MEDLDDKQDYEDFESRQKQEMADAALNMYTQSKETEEEREDEYSNEDDDMERDEIHNGAGYMSDPELRTAKRSVKFTR